MTYLRLLIALSALVVLCRVGMPQASSDGRASRGLASEDRPASAPVRALTWQTSDTSVTLLDAGKMVWQHVHDPNTGKPYMRFGLLDGTELTRPCPLPKGYKPSDHPWHRALWWSWKFIDGVNVWEKNEKGTFAGKAQVRHQDDGAAVITMKVVHGPDGGPALVNENRAVSVGAPDAAGQYLVEWEAVFAPAGEKNVVFQKNFYGGFAWRGAGEMARKPWQFFDHDGRKDGQIDRQKARWVAMTGKMANGREVCIAIFDHPSNPRHPAPWCVINSMPYFNPAFTGAEDYTLKAGTNLTLRYGVLVSPGKLDAAAVEQHWKTYAERKPKDGKPE
jgi:hypothetical protein